METNDSKKFGRPTIYTRELGMEICRRISEGESVRSIVKDEQMPSQAVVYFWLLDEDKKDFLAHYERARASQGEILFEKLDELASLAVEDIVGDDKSDNARVSARKLQVDTLKWRLSKMLPKKYGEKLDVTSDHKPIPLLYAIRDNDSHAEDQEA